MTYFGKGGTHGTEAHKALDAGCGGEDVAEEVPEPGHVGLRPHHAREEEEDDTEEDAAENTRHFLADK